MTATVAPRRLRIAFVYDALYPYQKGGAERRFHELASRLAQRHEVHAVSWRWWSGAADPSLDEVQLHGVGRAPRLYGNDGKRTVREVVGFSARLVPELARRRYDVIDCSATPYLPLVACRLASALTGTPMVATWHELWDEHWLSYLAHRPVVARLARLVEARATRIGDLRVAVSPFTAERLAAAGVPEPAIRVVGNGVAIEAFLRSRASRHHSDVAFVGRLIEDKRVDLLIEAVDRLRRDLVDLRCLIAGDGPERPRLEAEVGRRGLASHVSFTGEVDDEQMRGLLKAASVLALPSIREGFGMVAIEAQAAGAVPVVVRSPHSAAPTLIRDGVDGLVCEPNADSLTAALRALLTDPARLTSMRRRAAEAARRWDWDRLAGEMEQLYLELARAGARQPRPRWRLSWR